MQFQTLLKYPVVFLVAFCVTYLLTPLVARLALAFGVVDSPDERRIHSVAIPRAGGVAVFLGFHAACAAVFYLPWLPFQGNLNFEWWQQFLLVSTWLLVVGLLDDVLSLSPFAKLSGQLIAAILFFFGGFSVSSVVGVQLPELLDFFCTVFWYLTLINAFNLIDGLDGLAAGLGTIAALGIAGSMLFSQQPGSVLILLALAAACLAFLRFNFHPAQVFLGDTGSMFIGAAIASMALATGAKGSTAASVGIPLLAAGVPLFDTMLAVWRRSLRRFSDDYPTARVMGADLEHLHHRLLSSGFSQRKVATVLFAANGALVTVGILIMLFSSHQAGIFLLSFVLAAYVVVRHVAHTELWDSGSMILRGLRRPRGRVIAVMLYPVIDFLSLVISFSLTLWLIRTDASWNALKQEWLSKMPLWCAIPFIVLLLSGSYSRVWSRARISEYFLLALTLFVAIFSTLALRVLISADYWHEVLLKAVLYFNLSGILILASRAFPRTVSDLMAVYGEFKTGHQPHVKRVLIYGAGARCTLLLRQLSFHLLQDDTGNGSRSKVVGLLDDDLNLRKRTVHGYRVLGGLRELPQLIAADEIDEIVVACDLPSEIVQHLVTMTKTAGIRLAEWSTKYSTIVPTTNRPVSTAKRGSGRDALSRESVGEAA